DAGQWHQHGTPSVHQELDSLTWPNCQGFPDVLGNHDLESLGNSDCHHVGSLRIDMPLSRSGRHCHASGRPQPIVTTIFPKCSFARIIANASPSRSNGKVAEIGSASEPSATPAARSAQVLRHSSRISSLLRVRCVTPM